MALYISILLFLKYEESYIQVLTTECLLGSKRRRQEMNPNDEINYNLICYSSVNIIYTHIWSKNLLAILKLFLNFVCASSSVSANAELVFYVTLF